MSISQASLTLDEAPYRRPSEFRRGVAASTPVLLGIIPYALVLGAQAAQKGLSVVEVPLMTGMNFAGGSEFAAIQLWTSPPHILLIAAITLLVNSRHFLMGAALAPFLGHLPRRKVFPALFVMCDESWALGLADARQRAAAGLNPAFSLPYYAGAALPFYLAWVVFTTAGAALGPVLGNVEDYGFAMAFPAVFLVLMRGMWTGFAAARPWLVSLVVAALTYLIVPGAWYVAAGALSGLVSAWLFSGDEA
ncbi:MAG: branched-chain amino acid ABC transporter permease [Mesorhizobium sp.]|uniref:AzlC family ABC transporter permease n=1 Tax=unclassified Mesorhizobium TaxID=325217 RepID=UPI000F75058D|nr:MULTISPECIES: AzlC family ABC transporter permease [unclassified Mesorhizobium]RVD68790.1 branched-chain amino acid ABC transporter permease [Mesorhizobium sp. M4A.F.Ca.ET.029.04.2.1]AZO47775.1 branched-chain amino acid ABC transporter permease [Mesorhizobium sp. M4B.F.Ca.ET.058.02.1.1]RVC43363.1 branched-chain amino acid ABC transporter permease [Mesorhizobium sp. M4A.F.Ca.ET.090.04.2.1]RWC54678.1 MAG: branched-chain amino acid ABC transporter permease [Mesorhizobium sp.]RWD13053.1 MAG: br